MLNLPNNTVYSITSNTQAYFATITFLDNYGRPLENFQFDINDNSSIVPRTTDMNGEVVYDVSLNPEYVNSSRDFDLLYENGSISSNWFIDLARTVYDITAPNIEFISPNPSVPSEFSYLFADFGVEIDGYDYNSSDGVVTAGFNQGSLIILHNGTPVTPGSWIDGDTYFYTFDFVGLPFSVTAVNITIILTDIAGLTSQTTLIVTFDRFAPVISEITPGNESYPYGMGPTSVNVVDIGNSVIGVDARIITNTTDNTIPLTQVNATHWESLISYDAITSDALVIFSAVDDAGNLISVNYIYFLDAVNPSISITSIDINGTPITPGSGRHLPPAEEVVIVVDVTDSESGVSTGDFLVNSIPQSNVTKDIDEYTIIFITPVVTTTELQILSGTDRAGNPFSISLFTIFFDNIEPNIIINSPTDNTDPQHDTFTIEFDVIDLETSVNTTSVEITDKDSNLLNYSFISIINGYRFTLETTPDYNANSSSQSYNIIARDTYGNLNTSSFTIFTDVNDPTFGDFEIKEIEESIFSINPSNFNASGILIG
jgi:hypothetical protein